MKTIHKYPITLDLEHPIVVMMPKVAQVVLIGSQHDQAFLWAIVNPESPPVERRFVLIGTGQPIPSGHDHVASFLVGDGAFTCHLFE